MPDKPLKQILEEVITPRMVREIWSANYTDALPVTLQSFSVGALLPAVFYMARRGYRRGVGNFNASFAPSSAETEAKRASSAKQATVASVARVLSESESHFVGFETDLAKNVLADFLLANCVENQRREGGRKKPIIRAFPTHYQTAWIDLPKVVAHLRMVPETITAILANESEGESIAGDRSHKSLFSIGGDFHNNVLLEVFSKGMSARQLVSELVDDFDESAALGLDQLVSVRVARKCDQPVKLRNSGSASSRSDIESISNVSNQKPIAKHAAKVFREDFGTFIIAFGKTIPRQSLTQMLESSMSLGLTNLLLSTANSLFHWESTGSLSSASCPWPLFVDCSAGADNELRRLSEGIMDDCNRKLQRLPVVMMALRLLDWYGRDELDDLPENRPDATERINLLGQIIRGTHEETKAILKEARKASRRLADALEEAGSEQVLIALLMDEATIPNSVWRLAEAVTYMIGESLQAKHVTECLSSCLMTSEPNGLAVERRVKFQSMRNGKKSGLMKSIVLTDTMLDFLVHRHLRQMGEERATKSQPLSFSGFVKLLRERYGLHVDQPTPGQAISREVLLRNRQFLERRLRSLGLLVGVNDAESMKRLKPRFNADPGATHVDAV